MSIAVEKSREEPPLGHAAALAAKISRLLLLVICAGPVAVFPLGLAYKGYVHLFGAETLPATIHPTGTPQLPG